MRRTGESGSGLAPTQVDDGLSMEGTIQPRLEQVADEGIGRPRPAERGSTRTAGLGLGALAQHERAGEGVDVLDAHPRAVGHQLAPFVGRAQHAVGGGQDAEVLGGVVGQGDEPARLGVVQGRPEVVDGVLDPLAARDHHLRPGQRCVSGDGEPFGRVGAVQPDQHEGVVAGRTGAERKAAVGLLEDEHVAGGVGAQAVAPQLEGSLRLVEAHVEHELGPGGPGQAVAGVGHRLGGQGG